MRLALWRALLAPVTSLRALAILLRHRHVMTYDVAWRQARVLLRPDEMIYRLRGHAPPVCTSRSASRLDD